jgi:4-diphosphocytidyl-2-C-methyl-D-erythritol kinase
VLSIRVRSLAKINLDLRVLNKRPDGFHELRTVFQTISLADTIDIEYAPGRTRIDLESNLNIPDNLIVKAANAILAATRSTGRLRFRLKKRIPLGGGLGGGSSNAASILLALPVLLKKPLPLETLLELASGLGSDVPFFLLGGTCIGLGRGTELYPLPDGPDRPALVITPGVHVSTADAYGALNRKLTIELPSSIINSFQAFVWRVGGSSPGLDRGYRNDFENAVFNHHPQLKSIKGKLLKLGARPALMSGSGSSLFGIFGSRKQRDTAVASIRKVIGNDKVYPVSLTSRRRYRALWWRQLAGEIDSRTWPPQSQHVAG